MTAPLGERLSAELTFLALYWRVARRDGVTLGFTTHDAPLVAGGLQYDSAPGMTPSAVMASDGLDIDTMEVAGALTADAITAADLQAGRYDGAEVRLFMADWRAPDAGEQRLATGTLGTVTSGSGPDAGFTATLHGASAALGVTLIESYSPECRAELGDKRCRVAMRSRERRGVVEAVAGRRVTIAGLSVAAAAGHGQGRLRVLDGPAAGLETRITGSDAAMLLLDEALALTPGTPVELREGCDKRFATCAGRFANAANFRGEPHVPGGDLLTRFPGA